MSHLHSASGYQLCEESLQIYRKATASETLLQTLRCFPFQGWLKGASLLLPGLLPLPEAFYWAASSEVSSVECE